LKRQLANNFLFISADAAQEEEKRETRAAACWCFEVCSPCSSLRMCSVFRHPIFKSSINWSRKWENNLRIFLQNK
jgi:hypothetical protein